MSRFSDLVQDYMEWEKDVQMLKPFRLYKIYPDGTRVAEWDRRRGIPLNASQRNTMGASIRLIQELMWPINDMTRKTSVTSPKGHTIRIVPKEGKHKEYIRVCLGHDNPNGWMQVDVTFEQEGDNDG